MFDATGHERGALTHGTQTERALLGNIETREGNLHARVMRICWSMSRAAYVCIHKRLVMDVYAVYRNI